MKFAKIRDVKTPCRGTSKSSGIDFFVPNFSEEFINKMMNFELEENKSVKDLIILNNKFVKYIDENCFTLEPLGRVFIPSGIKVLVPENCDFVAHNKSGTTTKNGLIFGAHLVDEDYSGEIFMSIINVSSEIVKIYFGQKISQFVVRKVEYKDVEIVSEKDLDFEHNNRGTERGSGALGSTGVI